VNSDEEWQQAVHALAYDAAQRRELESACHRAYRDTYNMDAMMTDLTGAIEEVLPLAGPHGSGQEASSV
jgi:hypothetical protein